MALTGDQIEALTRNVVQLYQSAERSIVEVVTRYLAQGLDAPDWAVQRLGALATLRRTVERMLQLVQADGAESIRETLARAYRTGTAAATLGIPAHLLPRDPDAIRAAVAAAGIRVDVVENLAAALVADVGARHSNVLRHLIDVYRSVIQEATAVSVAGGMTRRQAAQHAYARFVDQGVVSFVDSGGRTWRLSSYVEMGVRTVTQRAAVQGQTDRLSRLGVDTVIVSNSPRECPLCRPWEGKVLSISGGLRGRVELPSVVRRAEMVTVDIAGSVTAARAAGLQHPNCTHSLRAYLPGATKAPKGELANPEGYEAKQRQRAIERQIRKWKERELAALTPEAKATAKGKVKAWQGAMRDHLKDNPELKRLPYRETPGAGNLPRPRPGATPETPPPPRPTPQPVRAAVPDAAAPYHRRVDGIEDLAAAVQRAGDAPRSKLAGGQSATTELVTLPDGTRLVAKRGMDWGDPDEVAASIRYQADAEQLASLVGRAIGAPVVKVYRQSDDQVWMNFLDGRMIGELDDTAALIAGRDAQLLGLLDHLAANADRNTGNIMVSGGRLTGIDHAFSWGEHNIIGDSGVVIHDDASRPGSWFSRDGQWVDNPLTLQDVDRLRERLTNLRPDFDHLGRGDWLDYSLGIVDQLAGHATGTVDLV